MQKTKLVMKTLSDILDYYLIDYHDIAMFYLKTQSVSLTIDKLVLRLAECHGTIKSYEMVELYPIIPEESMTQYSSDFLDDINSKIREFDMLRKDYNA